MLCSVVIVSEFIAYMCLIFSEEIPAWLKQSSKLYAICLYPNDVANVMTHVAETGDAHDKLQKYI